MTKKGEVYACGWGADGQTGVGHYRNTDRITKCVGDIAGEKIVKISCSADCVLALNGRQKCTLVISTLTLCSFEKTKETYLAGATRNTVSLK